MVRRHYLITGRVQGVGFRRFVQARAQTLGLTGAVRNLDDGRVEAIAQGDPASIKDFERLIAQGPAHSEVTDVVARDLKTSDDVKGLTASFSVLTDGEEPWFTGA